MRSTFNRHQDFIDANPLTASPSSTVDPVLVPLTLRVSFPSSKKVAVSGLVLHSRTFMGEKGLVLIDGQIPLSKLLMTMGTMIVQ